MNLVDIVKNKLSLANGQDPTDASSSFQAALEKRLNIFNISLKDFKINNKYDFNEDAANALVEIKNFELKHYASYFRKEQLSKIDKEELAELARLIEKLVKLHFKDESLIKDILLKIYAVETEVGYFDEEVLKGLNILHEIDSKIKLRAMNDIRLLFLEPFSEIRYPNLHEEDRNLLFIDFVSTFEADINYFMDCIKERDNARAEDKNISAKDLRNSLEE